MASFKQSLEALTNESGALVGLIYNVDGLGTFSRIDGSWKMEIVGAEGTEKVPQELEDEDVFISTNIDLSKGRELVERFDRDEEISEEEIDSKYAAPEEDE